MARYKKGKHKKENDLWTKAGGRKKIIQTFFRHGVGKGQVKWSTLAVAVFNSHSPDKKLAKWLQTVWTEDRKGVREQVLQTGSSGKYHIYLSMYFFSGGSQV